MFSKMKLKVLGYVLSALLLVGSGVVGMYYAKYKPVRNQAIEYRATIKELRKDKQRIIDEKDTLLMAYERLTRIPRYNILQTVSDVDVQPQSQVDFFPNSGIEIKDSVIVPPAPKKKKKGWWRRIFN